MLSYKWVLGVFVNFCLGGGCAIQSHASHSLRSLKQSNNSGYVQHENLFSSVMHTLHLDVSVSQCIITIWGTETWTGHVFKLIILLWNEWIGNNSSINFKGGCNWSRFMVQSFQVHELLTESVNNLHALISRKIWIKLQHLNPSSL